MKIIYINLVLKRAYLVTYTICFKNKDKIIRKRGEGVTGRFKTHNPNFPKSKHTTHTHTLKEGRREGNAEKKERRERETKGGERKGRRRKKRERAGEFIF